MIVVDLSVYTAWYDIWQTTTTCNLKTDSCHHIHQPLQHQQYQAIGLTGSLGHHHTYPLHCQTTRSSHLHCLCTVYLSFSNQQNTSTVSIINSIGTLLSLPHSLLLFLYIRSHYHPKSNDNVTSDQEWKGGLIFQWQKEVKNELSQCHVAVN